MKVIFPVLIGLLFSLFFTLRDISAEKAPLNADVNADAVVNMEDLIFVANHLGQHELTAADVNADGIVNIQDLVWIARALSGDNEPSTSQQQVTTDPGHPGMVLIPAGEFEMGSDNSRASPDEQPVHTVYVDAFYMDKYTVTNAAYKRFVDANPEWQKGRIDARFHDGPYLALWNGDTYPVGKADHPVTYVSWYAAMAYSAWAGKRLPTETEWEKAARGGLVGKKYPWGDEGDSTLATVQYWQLPPTTTPVGSYPPNAYGLYDMVGNVWEWCLDGYAADFYANSAGRNPIAGGESLETLVSQALRVESVRVLRGGGWPEDPRIPRVSVRDKAAPARALSLAGFRCVRNASP